MSHDHGRVVFEGPVASPALQMERWVRIYLPASYERSPDRAYPVLYVHDGQNAFTTVGHHVAYGWGNWQLDRTAGDLAAAGLMREIIIVAVDCGPNRYSEYRGPAGSNNRRYDAYRHFLLRELKPRIDSEYRTVPKPSATVVLGSSMGGICSLALAWEHPGVFGLAASLSGAFQVERRYFLLNVLRAYAGKPKRFRVYLDSGVTDGSGDDGRAVTAAVARELRRIGWRDGANLEHFVDERTLRPDELERAGLRGDKWSEAQSSQHNEFYWRLRAWRALTFLFPA